MSFINFCFWICFFHAWSSKTFCYFLCFQSLFWKISCFFCRSPFVCPKKNPLEKKTWLSLFFSFLLFLLHLFSLICVISSCLLSLLLVFSFSTLFLFFLFLLSLSMFPLSLCLPLSMFIYSLTHSLTQSLSLSLLCFFCLFLQKNTFIDFLLKKNLFICSSLLAKLFFVLSPLLFRSFFLICFFNRVLTNKRNWPFFSFGRKTICLIPPRIFLKFCHLIFFFFKKVFHRFPIFSLKSLSWKLFSNFVQKITQNGICNQQCLSRSHFLIIFLCWEKYPSLLLFKKNVFYHLLLVSFIVRESFLEKKISFEKIVFLKKTKHLLSPLDFAPFFLKKKLFSIFELSF